MNYTTQDMLDGLCDVTQVGTPRPSIESSLPISLPPGIKPSATVLLYLEAFHRSGGLDSLVEFARLNPGKFYDQLVRLLINMEAPKQSMQVTLRLESMTKDEVLNLPSSEIRRLLMEDVSPPLEN
jgi:hypothetical protein